MKFTYEYSVKNHKKKVKKLEESLKEFKENVDLLVKKNNVSQVAIEKLRNENSLHEINSK